METEKIGSQLCEERSRNIYAHLKRHDQSLNSYGSRLDQIEQDNSRFDERMNALITQLQDLNRMLKWVVGLFVSSCIGIFFFVIQNTIVK